MRCRQLASIPFLPGSSLRLHCKVTLRDNLVSFSISTTRSDASATSPTCLESGSVSCRGSQQGSRTAHTTSPCLRPNATFLSPFRRHCIIIAIIDRHDIIVLGSTLRPLHKRCFRVSSHFARSFPRLAGQLERGGKYTDHLLQDCATGISASGECARSPVVPDGQWVRLLEEGVDGVQGRVCWTLSRCHEECQTSRQESSTDILDV